MNQQNMAAMGGPVQMGTPSSGGAGGQGHPITQDGMMRQLNSVVYDYLLRNELWGAARQFNDSMQFDTRDAKPSPSQRGGQQANGADDGMDMDSKDPIILKKPEDLPLPSGFDANFLQDWWFQFWEMFNAHRYRGVGTRSQQSYLQTQRMVQNVRNQHARQVNQANQMGFNGMMQPNGVGMDLRRGAMQNSKNMTPTQAAQMKNMQASQANGQVMQGNNQMERSSSQMENMSGPRSGTPGSGDAPSPKRQRLEGGMQQLTQGRPGQPGQIQQGNQGGIPPNMGAGGAQGSPMSQPGMDGATGEFYAAANGGRMPMQGPNAAAAAAAGQGSNGNHALQDYQMQLMLLEQQNKKRLLMARQEQDSMAHPAGMGQNGGNFGTGSPTPGNMMDPANLPPQMRNQMMAANGQLRPPSSHPMTNMTPQQQQEMMARGGVPMPNGQFQPGQQPPQGQMMPGQQPGGQPGQGQQMGTPRQPNTNMPPPPAPQASTSGTGSPSAQPAPPTPSTQTKKGAANKKEAAGKKGAAQKKGAANATPASEAEHPPTPTPQTPITPMNAKSFSQNQSQGQNLPNGQPAQAGGPANAQANANANQQQQNQQQNANANPQPDPSGIAEPFGTIGGDADFPSMDLGFDSSDMLDNFDFDSFLNNDPADPFQFDANIAFGDAIGSGIEGGN